MSALSVTCSMWLVLRTRFTVKLGATPFATMDEPVPTAARVMLEPTVTALVDPVSTTPVPPIRRFRCKLGPAPVSPTKSAELTVASPRLFKVMAVSTVGLIGWDAPTMYGVEYDVLRYISSHWFTLFFFIIGVDNNH